MDEPSSVCHRDARKEGGAYHEQTITELSQKFDVHPNQITQWKSELLGQVSSVFEQGGSKEPSVDIKTLHAKIGELTLENDFLAGALTKAGFARTRGISCRAKTRCDLDETGGDRSPVP